jgi:hypothetical protein
LFWRAEYYSCILSSRAASSDRQEKRSPYQTRWIACLLSLSPSSRRAGTAGTFHSSEPQRSAFLFRLLVTPSAAVCTLHHNNIVCSSDEIRQLHRRQNKVAHMLAVQQPMLAAHRPIEMGSHQPRDPNGLPFGCTSLSSLLSSRLTSFRILTWVDLLQMT